MKKLIFLFVYFLFIGTAYGGGTCTLNSEGSDTKIGTMNLDHHFTCTADSSDASLAYTLTKDQMREIGGFYLYEVITRPGGTAPTDASDLAITDSRSRQIMTAAVNGLDLVDSTSTLWEYAEGPGAAGNHYPYIPFRYPLVLTVTNNAVVSAIIHIYLVGVR